MTPFKEEHIYYIQYLNGWKNFLFIKKEKKFIVYQTEDRWFEMKAEYLKFNNQTWFIVEDLEKLLTHPSQSLRKKARQLLK